MNTAIQYVAADGNDSYDGFSWAHAKSTWYAAATAIIAAGGGIIFMGPGSKAGGPVPGQGMWLTGMDPSASISGFLNYYNLKIRTIGVGGSEVPNPFSRQAVIVYGGSNLFTDYRTKPGAWVVGGGNQATFENIILKPDPAYAGTYGEGLFVPFRGSIDYNRNPLDGSIQYMTATSTSRLGGKATHVVSLPAGIATATATRSGTNVTLTIPRPAGQAMFPPWTNGTTVWIHSTDPNYPSEAYAVTLCQSTVDSQLEWGFTYDDGATVVGNPPLSGTITVSSPACQAGTFVEVQTTDFRVPPTQYQVVSATPTSATQATIVLTDPWGGFAGIGTGAVPATLTAGNYGVQIATLEMGYTASAHSRLENVTSTMSQSTGSVDIYASGPQFHFGSHRAFPVEMDYCYLSGFYPFPQGAPNAPYDKYRMAAVVCIIGTGVGGGGGVRCRRMTGGDASIVGLFGEENSLIEIEGLFDTGTGRPPPILDCLGGRFSIINVTGLLQVEDAVPGWTNELPQLVNYYPLNLLGNYSWSEIHSAAGSMTSLGSVAEWSTARSILKSPWAAPIGPAYGVWGGGTGGASGAKMSGPHPAAWRQISPTMARFQNLVPDPSTWVPAPATGVADPMGGNGAVSYDDTIHGTSTGGVLCSRTDTFFAAGGHFVMCGWTNIEDGATNPQAMFAFFSGGDLQWEPVSASGRQSDFLYVQEFGGAGWMFWYYAPKLISGSATQTYQLKLQSTVNGSGKNSNFFGIGAFWCPPTLDDNDVMEFIGTLRAQPYYLQPGMTGTFEGQKFIAHGGLGTAARYVIGTASGQIALGTQSGNAVEVFAEDGTSLGVLPTYAFTKNP